MSGDAQSQTIDERWSRVDELLSQYEGTLALPKNFKINVEEAMGFLQMTRDELRILDEEQCAEISFALSQLALYITKQANQEKAKYNWADAQIDGIIAPVINESKAYSFQEKRMVAIRNNSAAMKLQTLKVNAKTRIDRLDGIAQQIQFMAKSLNDLKFAKRGSNG